MWMQSEKLLGKSDRAKSVVAVDIREFRVARRLIVWPREGKTVGLRDRNRVIARIVPIAAPLAPRRRPDFAAIRHEIFGNRVLPGADLLVEMRGRF